MQTNDLSITVKSKDLNFTTSDVNTALVILGQLPKKTVEKRPYVKKSPYVSNSKANWTREQLEELLKNIHSSSTSLAKGNPILKSRTASSISTMKWKIKNNMDLPKSLRKTLMEIRGETPGLFIDAGIDYTLI